MVTAKVQLSFTAVKYCGQINVRSDQHFSVCLVNDLEDTHGKTCLFVLSDPDFPVHFLLLLDPFQFLNRELVIYIARI